MLINGFFKEQMDIYLNEAKNDIKFNIDLHTTITTIQNKLIAILRNSLIDEKWHILNMLTFISTFRFEEIFKIKRMHGKLASWQLVSEMINEAKNYQYEKNKLFEHKIKHLEVPSTAEPIECLEILIKYGIEVPRNIEKLIRFSYYNLALDYIDKPKPRPHTLGIESAAQQLSSISGKPIDTIHFLELAIGDAKLGIFCPRAGLLKKDNARSLRTISDIKSAEEEDLIEPMYLYDYEGLVRLHKIKNTEAFDNHTSKQTIEYLRDGAKIEPLSGMLVPQRSLRELILGVELISHFKNDDGSISINDLRLIEEEFIEFSDQYKNVKKLNAKISSAKSRKAAKKNGQLSAKTRREISKQKRARLKPDLLRIAKANPGKSANFIATRAAAADIIPDSQIRQTARYMDDPDYRAYLLKKN